MWPQMSTVISLRNPQLVKSDLSFHLWNVPSHFSQHNGGLLSYCLLGRSAFPNNNGDGDDGAGGGRG